MPDIPINYLAVLVCGVASMVLGSLWYGPLFGKQWIALSGMTPEQMEQGKKKGMAKLYALSFLGSLLMAYVLAHSLIFASSYFETSGISAGLMAGFWSWLGFVAPVTLGSVLWDGKPWRLWILNNGYQLLLLLIMGAILALWV
ncbi:MAG: hypothetical protein A2849_03215 [Candidatus Taylorbacteria bacterium RIFCSPHIGHO2_01_FULL_51_15]|uniref:DUF1761 domain-containing protein n=1 Tax=Candidatus Taylorbacteria bacterium RIFCSPHIGHO2_01_FULL_51_15 TaxID=1802304 RepID=A0A1G2MBT7_9BACT|nr:MAG: hypothetical protein A2849_03215 [Candidatus Taylorbacteria bacterium RIFCSPHIGHO2_01_FULL_51_15]